jgi:hypothetical protein
MSPCCLYLIDHASPHLSLSDGTLLRYIFALLSMFCALSIMLITCVACNEFILVQSLIRSSDIS